MTVSPTLAQEIGRAYAGFMPQGEQSDDAAKGDQEGMQFANISDQMAYETKKLMSQNSALDYAKASELVAELNPQLAENYKKWVMKFSGQ